eukprot:g60016.t1
MDESLPHLAEPRDTLRDGLGTLKSEVADPVHPVQQIQREFARKQAATKRLMLARVYGQHFPLRLQMEEAILTQFQRLPGLKSSFAGMESLTGRDVEIEFEDTLADPEFNPRFVDFHAEMDKRLGIAPAHNKFT